MLAGDLGQFNDVVMNYKDKFIAEKTYTLIIRYVYVVLCTYKVCTFTATRCSISHVFDHSHYYH